MVCRTFSKLQFSFLEEIEAVFIFHVTIVVSALEREDVVRQKLEHPYSATLFTVVVGLEMYDGMRIPENISSSIGVEVDANKWSEVADQI
jgi:hypothetical protein